MKTILSGLVGVALIAAASAAPVPLSGDAPVAVEKLRAGNPAVFPMTGTWKFQITSGREHAGTFVPGTNNVKEVAANPSKETSLDNFGQVDFDDTGFTNIPVPANWELEGFSKPTYDQPDDAVGL